MTHTDHLPTLLIVWHSRTGAARALADAAHQGALATLAELEASEQVRIKQCAAEDVKQEDLLQAGAYLFCAPENLAALSGGMKEFFDRYYYAALDQIAGRPYALAIAAGSDGTGAVRQAERICTGWRLRQVAAHYIAHTHAQSRDEILAPKTLQPDQIDAARMLGGTLAALLS